MIWVSIKLYMYLVLNQLEVAASDLCIVQRHIQSPLGTHGGLALRSPWIPKSVDTQVSYIRWHRTVSPLSTWIHVCKLAQIFIINRLCKQNMLRPLMKKKQ